MVSKKYISIDFSRQIFTHMHLQLTVIKTPKTLFHCNSCTESFSRQSLKHSAVSFFSTLYVYFLFSNSRNIQQNHASFLPFYIVWIKKYFEWWRTVSLHISLQPCVRQAKNSATIIEWRQILISPWNQERRLNYKNLVRYRILNLSGHYKWAT